MLKIYLDWNCISNIQTRHPKLYELIKEYGHLFIFPYSNVHIRDLIVSRNPKNEFFEKDLCTLTEICGKHHLAFEDNVMQPYFGYPKDYIDSFGDIWEIVQKAEFITPEQYQLIKDSVRERIPADVYNHIQGAKPKDVFRIVNEYFDSLKPGLTIQNLTLKDAQSFRQFMNREAEFKTLCMALDVIGFRPEKKNKAFTNIDADASHIFYAAHCDYLVSDDSKMRAKAEAMYAEHKIQTKVRSINQLEEMISKEVEKEYSLQSLLKCIDEFGHPRDEKDGAHYKLMDSPIWGLFNGCMVVDEHFGFSGTPNSALFVYSFNNTPYLFYTELTNFFDLVKSILPDDLKDEFQTRYVDEICSRDIKRAIDAKFSFECPDLNLSFSFYGDPISSVPCPMMQVRFA